VRVRFSMRDVVVITSPWKTIARRLPPSSPVTTSPACSAARSFGTVPKLRAAIHAGEVVAGEIGASRRAIVFHGDVMNTTSRIENLTRTLGHPFLVSEDAIVRMQGADAYALRDLGPQSLRGREGQMRVYAAALS